MQNNKAAACYKNKVVKNCDAINIIYSIDHTNGDGAKTVAESTQDSPEEVMKHPQIYQKKAANELVKQFFECLEI